MAVKFEKPPTKFSELTGIRIYTKMIILNELIEKIVVHEKVVDEDGTKSQRVDIYYKFIGCVNLRREGFGDDGKIQVRNKLLQERLEQIHSA